MISKRVTMNHGGKSSFSRLTNYLLNSQGKEFRVDSISITNCRSETPEWAALEIETTQSLNQRATGDKTYHLIISFPEGETPKTETLKSIETDMCNALGYGEHQRISVAHQDTDNFHIHLAINKIHPVRLTMHEPYRDYRIRDNVCLALEKKHSLQPDNHKKKRTLAEGRAQDMENMSGRESLLSWVRKHCAEAVNEAETWQQLHEAIAKYDIKLVPQGAGLVFKSGSGVALKASTVSRDFSKAKLEKRLGCYRTIEGQVPEPEVKYRGEPVHRSSHSAELFAEYSKSKSEGRALESQAVKGAINKRERLIAAAKRSANLKRQTLKTLARGRTAKRLVYMRINRSLQNEIKSIREEYARERNKIKSQHLLPGWNDWLRKQAKQGNDKALQVLRLQRSKPSQGNSIGQPQHKKDNQILGIIADGVTRKGTIIYQLHGQAVRDDGEKLILPSQPKEETLIATLSLAKTKYGNKLELSGDPVFRSRIAKIAGKNYMDVNFTDIHSQKVILYSDPNRRHKAKQKRMASR
ncbi:TraI/MobA(P) family conjugative relaxase [Alcanivorax sp.]|uniref:TraI/MobA(P) family conjugative relaxase n=1 Tax=Alcanivorax sp. TaxID=1872427 RepID=UPI002B275A8A|nr:TraI/MobA(P) family conjugative relaxase [Alcanivorax sp.]